MEIENDTDKDAKVRVSGGGAGVAPHGRPSDDESVAEWASLPPGGRLKHSPPPPGPWTVCFAVNGRRILEDVPPRTRRVTLTPSFQIEVE